VKFGKERFLVTTLFAPRLSYDRRSESRDTGQKSVQLIGHDEMNGARRVQVVHPNRSSRFFNILLRKSVICGIVKKSREHFVGREVYCGDGIVDCRFFGDEGPYCLVKSGIPVEEPGLRILPLQGSIYTGYNGVRIAKLKKTTNMQGSDPQGGYQ
jgi:hypothetical protein